MLVEQPAQAVLHHGAIDLEQLGRLLEQPFVGEGAVAFALEFLERVQQARVDALYEQPEAWARKAILKVAGMGFFSSDRTIREYAREVWGLQAKG